jgi:hypothetical protein
MFESSQQEFTATSLRWPSQGNVPLLAVPLEIDIPSMQNSVKWNVALTLPIALEQSRVYKHHQNEIKEDSAHSSGSRYFS